MNTIDWSQKISLDKQGIDFLRKSLGHPHKLSTSVRCVVASPNGMDSSSSTERFLVAARLWADGISAEYMPQSGVILSLLKQIREDETTDPGASVRIQYLLQVLQVAKTRRSYNIALSFFYIAGLVIE